MDKWRKFLLEGKTFGLTIDEVLELVEEYGKNTWIFFDTETTGLHPKNEQITEIAAIAVSPSSWQEEPRALGTFHKKIRLNADMKARMSDPESPQRQAWDREQKGSRRALSHPRDILRMTQYGERGRAYIDEQEALTKFEDWIQSFDSPMLVAQNASFDMKFVNTRKDVPMARVPVLDTVPLLQQQVIPVLRTIRDGEFQEYDPRYNPRLAARAKDILNNLKAGRFYSVSLARVATAFDVDAENWHSALADTQMLVSLFQKIYAVLNYASQAKLNVDPERRVAHKLMRQRAQYFARKKK